MIFAVEGSHLSGSEIRRDMTDKKVLVALADASTAWGVVRFLQEYIVGENVEITLCFLARDEHLLPEHEEVMDYLSAVCMEKSARMRIRRLSKEPHKDLEQLTAYADLLVISKSALRPLALEFEFTNGACALIAVPDHFEKVDNIVLISDGSRAGVRGFKQFFQIFPHWSNEPDLTLLRVLQADEIPGKSQDEVLLLDYLKHYSGSVGILKVPEPLTAKLLRPLRYDERTLVVGRINSLLSYYGNANTFKPFYDDNSALYLPPELV